VHQLTQFIQLLHPSVFVFDRSDDELSSHRALLERSTNNNGLSNFFRSELRFLHPHVAYWLNGTLMSYQILWVIRSFCGLVRALAEPQPARLLALFNLIHKCTEKTR
jgi:hypothetical protein